MMRHSVALVSVNWAYMLKCIGVAPQWLIAGLLRGFFVRRWRAASLLCGGFQKRGVERGRILRCQFRMSALAADCRVQSGGNLALENPSIGITVADSLGLERAV